MKPSNFNRFPFSSVLQNAEAEVIAQNIMVILARSGNKFRSLSWKEYQKERLKDGNFTASEEEYFNQVKKFCVSGDTAVCFSEHWANIK